LRGSMLDEPDDGNLTTSAIDSISLSSHRRVTRERGVL
jgi:hypothetical protein